MYDEARDAVVVDDLTKRYDEVVAVDGLSFRVRQGELFAIVGPNGAGKTTTVEILCSYRTPTEGNAEVLGYDVTENPEEIRSEISVLPEGFTVHGMLTVRENLEYFANLYDSHLPIDEVLGRVEMLTQAPRLFKNLSQGQQRRVGLALALLNDGDLMILDEPTVNLDPLAQQTIRDHIADLRDSGKSIIITTHDLHEAQELADRILVLNESRLISLGSPNELVEDHEGYWTISVRGDDLDDVLKPHASQDGGGSDEYVIQARSLGKLQEVLGILDDKRSRVDSIEITAPTLWDVFPDMVEEASR